MISARLRARDERGDRALPLSRLGEGWWRGHGGFGREQPWICDERAGLENQHRIDTFLLVVESAPISAYMIIIEINAQCTGTSRSCCNSASRHQKRLLKDKDPCFQSAMPSESSEFLLPRSFYPIRTSASHGYLTRLINERTARSGHTVATVYD